jgi:hypothetical protein
MPPEKLEQELRELPGKSYETTAALFHDWEDAKGEDQQKATLRFWGKKLTEKPSQTRPGTTYFEFENSENPDDHVDGQVFKIKEDRHNLLMTQFDINVHDYDRRDDKGRPLLAAYFTVAPKNIGDFRIEVVPSSRWQAEMKEKYPNWPK